MTVEKSIRTMTMTSLRIGLGLASRSICVALLLATGCLGGGPAGPIPGSGFTGEAESDTNDIDWSYARDVDSVDIEIAGESPRSVRTGFIVYEGVAHLPVTWAPLKRWPDVVRQHPHVRVRIEEKLFAFHAREITDLEQLTRLRETGQNKYGAPFHARSLNDSTFYFRLDPLEPE